MEIKKKPTEESVGFFVFSEDRRIAGPTEDNSGFAFADAKASRLVLDNVCFHLNYLVMENCIMLVLHLEDINSDCTQHITIVDRGRRTGVHNDDLLKI